MRDRIDEKCNEVNQMTIAQPPLMDFDRDVERKLHHACLFLTYLCERETAGLGETVM